ncbi:hypothetical protein, partial [Chryseobacterium sp. CH1]|uniref:hypothetical protein n=1 Tax=Chryseobacterium sp. CH1 TaxID=713551 RepID=UPI001026EF5E
KVDQNIKLDLPLFPAETTAKAIDEVVITGIKKDKNLTSLFPIRDIRILNSKLKVDQNIKLDLPLFPAETTAKAIDEVVITGIKKD